MGRTIAILFLYIFTLNVSAGPNIAGSWSTTKKWARDKIYKDHRVTFYCDCQYTSAGGSGGTIGLESCGYDGSESSHANRASRLEWEHVVPASLMPARKFACWNGRLQACNEPGRDCCEKHDPTARAMIFDLHNLVPSVGQANALRSNSRYGIVDGEDRKLGRCDFEWASDLTEPAPLIRGDVARVWLYMYSHHGLEISEDELAMFLIWSQRDQPDEWEVERNNKIKEVQGNSNPWVDMYLP